MKREILLSSLLATLGVFSLNGQQTAPTRPVIPTPTAPPAAPMPPSTAPQQPQAAPTPPLTAAPAGSPTLPASPTLPGSPTLPAPPTLVPGNQGLPLGAQQGTLGVQQGALGSNVLGMTTNAMLGTNQFGTNQILAIQDQAVTIPDQRLLVQIRNRVQPALRNVVPGTASMPVAFLVQQNVVSIVGEVLNDQQKQQIVELVQNTPGVVRVVDGIKVNPQANFSRFATGSSNAANLMIATNLSSTGNGLNRVFSTNFVVPRSVQGTQQLPPGTSQ